MERNSENYLFIRRERGYIVRNCDICFGKGRTLEFIKLTRGKNIAFRLNAPAASERRNISEKELIFNLICAFIYIKSFGFDFGINLFYLRASLVSSAGRGESLRPSALHPEVFNCGREIR